MRTRWWCAVVVASWASNAYAEQPERIVLAVGVNRFEHGVPRGTSDLAGWPELAWAEKDAHDVVRALGRYGFEPWGGRVWTGTVATTARVRSALLDIAAHVRRAAHRKFEVVVYVSSHGLSIPRRDSDGPPRQLVVLHDTPARVILEHDASDDVLDRHWIADDLIGRLDEASVENVAVIYDVCDVGKVSTSLKGAVVQSPEQAAADEFERRRLRGLERSALVLAAAGSGQAALELDALENGVYTHHLVQALEGASAEVQATILPGLPLSLFSGHQWARKQVEVLRGNNQTPSWAAPRSSRGLGFFFLQRADDIRLGPTSAVGQRAVILLEDTILAGRRVMVRALEGMGERSGETVFELTSDGITFPSGGRFAIEVIEGDLVTATEVVEIRGGDDHRVDVSGLLGRRPRVDAVVMATAEVPLAGWGETQRVPAFGVRGGWLVDGAWWADWVTGAGLSATVSQVFATDGTAELLQTDWGLWLDVQLARKLAWGSASLAVGPSLGAGFLRRVRPGEDADDRWTTRWGPGMAMRGRVAISAALTLQVELASRVELARWGDQGDLVLGLSMGIGPTWPGVRARDEEER